MQYLPMSRSPVVSSAQLLLNYVLVLVHPSHEEDSSQDHSGHSTYFHLILNNYRWWFALRLRNPQTEPPRWWVCLDLLASIHIKILMLRIHLRRSSQFGFFFVLSLKVNFIMEYIFLHSFGRQSLHAYERMFLSQHLGRLIWHWILLWEVFQRPIPRQGQNQYLRLFLLLELLHHRFS